MLRADAGVATVVKCCTASALAARSTAAGSLGRLSPTQACPAANMARNNIQLRALREQ